MDAARVDAPLEPISPEAGPSRTGAPLEPFSPDAARVDAPDAARLDAAREPDSPDTDEDAPDTAEDAWPFVVGAVICGPDDSAEDDARRDFAGDTGGASVDTSAAGASDLASSAASGDLSARAVPLSPAKSEGAGASPRLLVPAPEAAGLSTPLPLEGWEGRGRGTAADGWREGRDGSLLSAADAWREGRDGAEEEDVRQALAAPPAEEEDGRSAELLRLLSR